MELQATSLETSHQAIERDLLVESATPDNQTKLVEKPRNNAYNKTAAFFASMGLLFIGVLAFLYTLNAARSQLGAMATFGFNPSVLRTLAAYILCLGIGSILHFLASGKKRVQGVTLFSLVALCLLASLQLADFSKAIRAVEMQVENPLNHNRLVASMHEDFLNPLCGNKYHQAPETYSTFTKWENPKAPHGGLNPGCAKAAKDAVTSTMDRLKLLVTVVLLLFVVVLGGASGGSTLGSKGKNMILAAALVVSAIALVVSKFMNSEFDPALQSFSSNDSTGSAISVSCQYNPSSSYEVHGSLDYKSCPPHWAVIVSNYGTTQESFHQVKEDCTFSLKQSAGHSRLAVVVNHQKNIIELADRQYFENGVIRLNKLPVVLSHEKILKLTFFAEDILTGEQIDNFKVTISSNLKGDIVREISASRMNILVSTELVSGYYTAIVSAPGYESKKIQFEELLQRQNFKTYLMKVDSGLLAIERRVSDISANQLVARSVYPDKTVCQAMNENPNCAGVVYLTKESEDENHVVEVILISKQQDNSVEVSLGFKSPKIPSAGHRLLAGSTGSKLEFDDMSIISRAGLRSCATHNRFTKLAVTTLADLNKKKYTYNHPLDIVKVLLPTPGDWVPKIYEVIPVGMGKTYPKVVKALDETGTGTIFGGVLPNQLVRAAKFQGDDGAVWYAMIYNGTEFAVVTDGVNDPSIIRSPGGPVAQILNEGDKVYPTLRNIWLSVTMPNGSYFNFDYNFYKNLTQLPFTPLAALPKLDIQSSNALNSKLTAFGSILGDLIVEVLNTTEYRDMMDKLKNFGQDIRADIYTSSVYIAKRFKTYTHHNATANYRICLPCLFFELKRLDGIDKGFNTTFVNGKLTYKVREDRLESLFWRLQHRVPTVTFVEGDHEHVNSLFAEVNTNRYLEMNRTDMASIIKLQMEGVLKNVWVKRMEKNETKVDGNLTPLIIYDNLLFRLNMEVARKFTETTDREAFEPELYKLNISNKVDSRSDYYGGLSLEQPFLEKLFQRYANVRGVFTRSNHRVPVRTWPFVLRKEDSVVNKYYFNLIEARAALGITPVPYSGIKEPYSKLLKELIFDRNNGKFTADPKPLPPASVYLDSVPVIFTDGTSQVPTGQCLDNLANLHIHGLFPTYNRTTKKLHATERSVFIKNHLLRILETKIIVDKFAKNNFSSPAEEKVFRDCFPVTSAVLPPLPQTAFPVHFVLHDNMTFSVGSCTGNYTNGLKCDGVFTGTDVRCNNNLSINGVQYSNLTNANMTSNNFGRLVVNNPSDISCDRIETNNFACQGQLVPGFCQGNFSGHYDNASVVQDIETNKTTQGNFSFLSSKALTPSTVDYDAKSRYSWSSDSYCELSYKRLKSECQRAWTNGTITFNDGAIDFTGKVMIYCEGILQLDLMNCTSGLFQATMCNNSFSDDYNPSDCSGSFFYRTCPNGGNLTTCAGGQDNLPSVNCIGRYFRNGTCIPKTLIPIININATHWLKGSCNETIKDNKCVGIFNATSDQVVRCTGRPNISQADYDACVPDRGTSFESCRGVTSERGCEGLYRQNVTIGSELWTLQSINPGVYNYSTLTGLSRHTWINPATTGDAAEISKRVRCSHSVQPGRLYTCNETQYIWFDDQDDTGIPGTNRRRDILCTSGMQFDYPTLSCRGVGNHTYQEGVGRNAYGGDLRNYTVLGNLTKVLCVNGGAQDKCFSDVGKLTYNCMNHYYIDFICQKDVPNANREINITFTGISYKLDIYGKKFKVCNFVMPSFMTSNTYTTFINLTNQVVFRVQLRNYTQDPVTGDLNNVTIPRDVTNVAFDEGRLNLARFKDFRIDGFDFRRLAVDDNCKYVNIKIRELLVKKTVVDDLISNNGVIQNVQLVTNVGANQIEGDNAILPNFGYQTVNSPLAYGEIFLRNAEIYLPYISAGYINTYLNSDPSKVHAESAVVPLVGEDLPIYPFNIGITADKKDIFLEYKEFRLKDLSLDLLTLQDWLLSSSTIKNNAAVVSKLLNGYTLDERLYKLYGNPPKP